MSLLRPSQLAALRRLTTKLFNTKVEIWKRTVADSVYSDEDIESFALSETVDGWLRSLPEDSVDVSYGQTHVAATHRLFVPVATDVAAFDQVKINGATYKVIDTSVESSYKVLLRVLLRKSE